MTLAPKLKVQCWKHSTDMEIVTVFSSSETINFSVKPCTDCTKEADDLVQRALLVTPIQDHQ
jgi:hypothetical protein